jgi:hypothetical protein
MVAASNDVARDSRLGREFGYQVGAGKLIYRGSLVAITAAGVLQPAGQAGGVAIAGLAERKVDNTAGLAATTGEPLRCRRGPWAFPQNDFTFADIGNLAYAVDDSTLSRDSSSGTRLKAGTLVGIEGGRAFVEI